MVEIHAILTTQQTGNKTLLSSIRYGDISIFQADFSFAPLKSIIQTLIVEKCSKTISLLFISKKTVLMYFLNIVTLHDVIYVQNEGF